MFALLITGAAFISWPAGAVHADEVVVIGGDVRARTEYKRPLNYVTADGGEPTGEDGTSLRSRVHLHWVPNEDVNVFLQLQDSRFFGVDSVNDNADDDLDVRQAYVSLNAMELPLFEEIGVTDAEVRVGRIGLPTFGDGYIIGSNDWEVVGPIAFEGFWLSGLFGDEEAGVDFDLLWMDFSNNDPTGGNAIGPAEDTVYWGLNVATNHVPLVNIEAYSWFLNRPKDVDELIYGWRLETEFPESCFLHDFFGVFEYAVSGGERGTLDVDANFWVLRGEYDFELFDLPHTVGIGYSHATGTPGSASDDETWDAPLAESHRLLGQYDLVSNSNVNDFFVHLSVAPTERTSLDLQYHMFTLDEEDDGWETVTGGTVGAGGSILDDDLGSEIDVRFRFTPNNTVDLSLGFSLFQAGDAVEDATGGFDDDGSFVFFEMGVNFGEPPVGP